jgi:NAD(P)-dependent dehydrogenase (short-subunit alcohol dehydrogenase family)
MITLGGKVCVVTGALGLIGAALVRALLEAGGRVVVTDLEHGACVDRAHALGSGALGHGADITRRDSLVTLLAAVLDRFGRIDVLINSAAIDDRFGGSAAHDSMFEHYDLERWRRILDANLTGTFLCCQILGGGMLGAGRGPRDAALMTSSVTTSARAPEARTGGSIINVASTYGIVAPDQSLYRTPSGEQPFFKSPAYPTSKAAVLGFTRYLAAYWGQAGIRVNALSPGGVENGQPDYFVASYAARTPLGRMATPGDYAGAAVFLASDASSYMTGANLVVDGGFTTW